MSVTTASQLSAATGCSLAQARAVLAPYPEAGAPRPGTERAYAVALEALAATLPPPPAPPEPQPPSELPHAARTRELRRRGYMTLRRAARHLGVPLDVATELLWPHYDRAALLSPAPGQPRELWFPPEAIMRAAAGRPG